MRPWETKAWIDKEILDNIDRYAEANAWYEYFKWLKEHGFMEWNLKDTEK